MKGRTKEERLEYAAAIIGGGADRVRTAESYLGLLLGLTEPEVRVLLYLPERTSREVARELMALANSRRLVKAVGS